MSKEFLKTVGEYSLVVEDGKFCVYNSKGSCIDSSEDLETAENTFNLIVNNDLRDYFNQIFRVMRGAYARAPACIFTLRDLLYGALSEHYSNCELVLNAVVNKLVYYRQVTLICTEDQKRMSMQMFTPYVESAVYSAMSSMVSTVEDLDSLGDLLCSQAKRISALVPGVDLKRLIHCRIDDEFLTEYVDGCTKEVNYLNRKFHGAPPISLTPFANIVHECMTSADADLRAMNVSYMDRRTLFGSLAVLTQDEAKRILVSKFGTKGLDSEVTKILDNVEPFVRKGFSENRYIACCQYLCC